MYGQIRTIDPRCSRDEFKQLLRAGRAQHLIKTGKKPHKWVSLRPECLTAKTSDGRTSEELVDSGHESSSSDEDDTLCEVPIPLGFDILVRALRDIGPTGDYSMKLGDVAVLIAKHNRRPYLLAGVGKLKAYLEVGERHGVIQRVGPKTTYLMGHVALADARAAGGHDAREEVGRAEAQRLCEHAVEEGQLRELLGRCLEVRWVWGAPGSRSAIIAMVVYGRTYAVPGPVEVEAACSGQTGV